MSHPTFTGREVATVLIEMGHTPVDRTGSHFQLRYEHPETGEVRNVTVPLHGEIQTGTLRTIASADRTPGSVVSRTGPEGPKTLYNTDIDSEPSKCTFSQSRN